MNAKVLADSSGSRPTVLNTVQSLAEHKLRDFMVCTSFQTFSQFLQIIFSIFSIFSVSASSQPGANRKFFSSPRQQKFSLYMHKNHKLAAKSTFWTAHFYSKDDGLHILLNGLAQIGETAHLIYA